MLDNARLGRHQEFQTCVMQRGVSGGDDHRSARLSTTGPNRRCPDSCFNNSAILALQGAMEIEWKLMTHQVLASPTCQDFGGGIPIRNQPLVVDGKDG